MGLNNWSNIKYYFKKIKQYMQGTQYVENQTFEMCLSIVQENDYVLQYVKNQTPEICLTAVQKNGLDLEYVREQTPEICLAAVKQNSWALEYVEHQTPEICVAAIKQNPDAVEFIKLPANEKQRAVFLKKLIFLMNAKGLDTSVLKNLKEHQNG